MHSIAIRQEFGHQTLQTTGNKPTNINIAGAAACDATSDSVLRHGGFVGAWTPPESLRGFIETAGNKPTTKTSGTKPNKKTKYRRGPRVDETYHLPLQLFQRRTQRRQATKIMKIQKNTKNTMIQKLKDGRDNASACARTKASLQHYPRPPPRPTESSGRGSRRARYMGHHQAGQRVEGAQYSMMVAAWGCPRTIIKTWGNRPITKTTGTKPTKTWGTKSNKKTKYRRGPRVDEAYHLPPRPTESSGRVARRAGYMGHHQAGLRVPNPPRRRAPTPNKKTKYRRGLRVDEAHHLPRLPTESSGCGARRAGYIRYHRAGQRVEGAQYSMMVVAGNAPASSSRPRGINPPRPRQQTLIPHRRRRLWSGTHLNVMTSAGSGADKEHN
ncbi:hypothetical protein EDC01DRAFT_628281 [Geopyxis carbonaria]|nr:hypothetical protein EDC01DRAFT_628281 [Geopyxis carbonaria]